MVRVSLNCKLLISDSKNVLSDSDYFHTKCVRKAKVQAAQARLSASAQARLSLRWSPMS